MLRNDLIAAIREMMERHWDIYSIASKMKIDPIIVQQIIDQFLS